MFVIEFLFRGKVLIVWAGHFHVEFYGKLRIINYEMLNHFLGDLCIDYAQDFQLVYRKSLYI